MGGVEGGLQDGPGEHGTECPLRTLCAGPRWGGLPLTLGAWVLDSQVWCPQHRAMAQKSPTRDGTHFPYKDLASEVTRRRVTMITRYSAGAG